MYNIPLLDYYVYITMAACAVYRTLILLPLGGLPTATVIRKFTGDRHPGYKKMLDHDHA